MDRVQRKTVLKPWKIHMLRIPSICAHPLSLSHDHLQHCVSEGLSFPFKSSGEASGGCDFSFGCPWLGSDSLRSIRRAMRLGQLLPSHMPPSAINAPVTCGLPRPLEVQTLPCPHGLSVHSLNEVQERWQRRESMHRRVHNRCSAFSPLWAGIHHLSRSV